MKKSPKRSKLESILLYQIEDANLPTPDTEVAFCDGRKWRFDIAWPEYMLAVEVEGGIYNAGRHVRPKGFENDCEKYNMSQILGWKLIRVTGGMITDGRAIKTIQQAFDTIEL